jgi:hypothetical protein
VDIWLYFDKGRSAYLSTSLWKTDSDTQYSRSSSWRWSSGISTSRKEIIDSVRFLKGHQHRRSPCRCAVRFFPVLSKMPSSDASAISTTFTPPATCTQTHLTLMEYYAYQIWLNYPVPVPGITSTDCYPSQYMSSYFSAQYVTTPLPAPTPLVCPVGYGTILSTTVSSSEYVACCPSYVATKALL